MSHYPQIPQRPVFFFVSSFLTSDFLQQAFTDFQLSLNVLELFFKPPFMVKVDCMLVSYDVMKYFDELTYQTGRAISRD
jgi:hypothetical protein